ncbi:unnamed protein product [Cladocopium goreaui]|uniref:Uncharacterized protein n=1 Tax=Cladocopium goreaui TaxID=2562237 RepID=A0A9P1D4K3_9DINO|nr:unnamed protein product [Cladocopium goreaui]
MPASSESSSAWASSQQRRRSGVLRVLRCESLASAANMPTAALANSCRNALSSRTAGLDFNYFK